MKHSSFLLPGFRLPGGADKNAENNEKNVFLLLKNMEIVVYW